MDQTAEAEVIAVYHAYLNAFMANNLDQLNELVQYPLAHIGSGNVTLVDSYPVQPAELMAAKRWHSTKDMDYEVVFVSCDKAHLVLRSATRIRADGSTIETISGFYALTRTSSGWKFFAFSDIIVPAS